MPARCITGVKWIVGVSFPPHSLLLTTGCSSARAVKQDTSHTRNLQRVGFLKFFFKYKKTGVAVFKELSFLSLWFWDQELNSSPDCPSNVP